MKKNSLIISILGLIGIISFSQVTQLPDSGFFDLEFSTNQSMLDSDILGVGLFNSYSSNSERGLLFSNGFGNSYNYTNLDSIYIWQELSYLPGFNIIDNYNIHSSTNSVYCSDNYVTFDNTTLNGCGTGYYNNLLNFPESNTLGYSVAGNLFVGSVLYNSQGDLSFLNIGRQSLSEGNNYYNCGFNSQNPCDGAWIFSIGEKKFAVNNGFNYTNINTNTGYYNNYVQYLPGRFFYHTGFSFQNFPYYNYVEGTGLVDIVDGQNLKFSSASVFHPNSVYYVSSGNNHYFYDGGYYGLKGKHFIGNGTQYSSPFLYQLQNIYNLQNRGQFQFQTNFSLNHHKVDNVYYANSVHFGFMAIRLFKNYNLSSGNRQTLIISKDKNNYDRLKFIIKDCSTNSYNILIDDSQCSVYKKGYLQYNNSFSVLPFNSSGLYDSTMFSGFINKLYNGTLLLGKVGIDGNNLYGYEFSGFSLYESDIDFEFDGWGVPEWDTDDGNNNPVINNTIINNNYNTWSGTITVYQDYYTYSSGGETYTIPVSELNVGSGIRQNILSRFGSGNTITIYDDYYTFYNNSGQLITASFDDLFLYNFNSLIIGSAASGYNILSSPMSFYDNLKNNGYYFGKCILKGTGGNFLSFRTSDVFSSVKGTKLDMNIFGFLDCFIQSFYAGLNNTFISSSDSFLSSPTSIITYSRDKTSLFDRISNEGFFGNGSPGNDTSVKYSYYYRFFDLIIVFIFWLFIHKIFSLIDKHL